MLGTPPIDGVLVLVAMQAIVRSTHRPGPRASGRKANSSRRNARKGRSARDPAPGVPGACGAGRSFVVDDPCPLWPQVGRDVDDLGFASGLPAPRRLHVGLDQVCRRAVKDVAEGGQRPHREAFGLVGDEAVDLDGREIHAAVTQQGEELSWRQDPTRRQLATPTVLGCSPAACQADPSMAEPS
jgi:hypothetical protein